MELLYPFHMSTLQPTKIHWLYTWKSIAHGTQQPSKVRVNLRQLMIMTHKHYLHCDTITPHNSTRRFTDIRHVTNCNLVEICQSKLSPILHGITTQMTATFSHCQTRTSLFIHYISLHLKWKRSDRRPRNRFSTLWATDMYNICKLYEQQTCTTSVNFPTHKNEWKQQTLRMTAKQNRHQPEN